LQLESGSLEKTGRLATPIYSPSPFLVAAIKMRGNRQPKFALARNASWAAADGLGESSRTAIGNHR
jgi:hypothetical protein